MHSNKTLLTITLSLIATSNTQCMETLTTYNRLASCIFPIKQNHPIHIQKTLISLNNKIDSIQPDPESYRSRGNRSNWWAFNLCPACYTVELIKNECQKNSDLKNIMEEDSSYFLSIVKSLAAKFSLSDRHITVFFSRPPQRCDFDSQQIVDLENMGVQFESNHWSSRANSLIINAAKQRLDLQQEFDNCIQKEKQSSSSLAEEWNTFIQQGIDVNFSNYMGSDKGSDDIENFKMCNGYTPLHWAVYRHPLNITLMKWLMEHGADTNDYEYSLGNNILDTFLWNAFNGYCRYKNTPHAKCYSLTDEEMLAIIDLFQKHAQDKNITNICSNANVSLLMNLLLNARKTDLFTQIKQDTPSLEKYRAAKKVDEKTSKILQENRSFSKETLELQEKFNTFIKESSTKDAVFSINEFNAFMQAKIDMNFTGGKPCYDKRILLRCMYSSLHQAVSQRHLNLDLIAALIDHKADVNFCYPDLHNPRYPLEQLIWYAFRYGSCVDDQFIATIKLLLNAGADLNKIHPDSSIFIRLLLINEDEQNNINSVSKL
jgi:hypothetical protein